MLEGQIALVTGATRGAGRGIAIELAAAGATVYCTGRSTREQPSEVNRPETIEETAELIQKAGGKGIAVQVDHLKPNEVQALVERIEREQGRLDILINDIWGADFLIQWNTPAWEYSLARWNGQSLSSGQLAKVYGFTDVDGSQPDAWRYVVEVQDAGKPADATGYR